MRYLPCLLVVVLLGCGGPADQAGAAPEPAEAAAVPEEAEAAAERPVSREPTAGTSFIPAVLEEFAADLSWARARWRPRGGARPVVGDWAAVVEPWPPDSPNPALSRKRDMVVAWGRVLEVTDDTVKIALDRAHSEPRLRAGQAVLIRWY